MSPPFGTRKWRLYRIDRDPAELQNLAEEEPEKLEELKALWEEYAHVHGVLIPEDEPAGDEAPEKPVAQR